MIKDVEENYEYSHKKEQHQRKSYEKSIQTHLKNTSIIKYMNRESFSTTIMNKKIVVSQENLAQLNKLRQSKETYDDVVQKLLQEHNKKLLQEQAKNIRNGKETLYELEDI